MHSLQSPSDRSTTDVEKHRITDKRELTPQEVHEAIPVLVKDHSFLQVDRYFTDPFQYGQKTALFSFVPSKQAKPDPDGFFGMMKIRGVYATDEEAKQRAEFLIRTVDSYHEIFHVHVGRPFPVTSRMDCAASIDTIDIRKKTTEMISEDILHKKKQEKDEIENMKEREKQLLKESEKAKQGESMDSFDLYITENVKRAQLLWTYKETLAKLRQMETSYYDTIQHIQELDVQYPEYKDQYKDKYMKARREVDLPDTEDSFLQYLSLDLDVDIKDIK